MYQELKRRCTAIVLVFKPFVWRRSRCRCRRVLRKVPIVWTGKFLNPERKSCGLENIRSLKVTVFSQRGVESCFAFHFPLYFGILICYFVL